ncbi:MAG: DUF2283 domain-containing protein [Candidatus Nanohaloarchaea archaeon]|nr:DUF2283 domain-containing protein [Candidatus Nanohaloarchaea archaeon]
MSEYRIDYELGADLLWVKVNDRDIKKSLNLGDLTVDFGREGDIAGIELLNASKNLVFESDKTPESILEDISDAEIQARYTENGFFMVLRLYSEPIREECAAMMTETGPLVKA